jgi:general secretion pathway protein C
MKISPRYFVWINLVLLALVAYWGAATVSAAVAAKLNLPPQVHLSQPPPPIAREPRRPASYYANINTRDIFNSTKPEAEKPPEPPKPTELKLKLWGTAVHTDGSSYCIIEDLTTHKQDVYRINEVVTANAVVKDVEWDRVILDRDGQEEILELASAQGGPPRPVAAVTAAVPSQPTNPHVQQVSENQYTIDRSEVDAALDNMNQLFTQIRAVPHFEGGKSTGFRLFAIRQNSIFDNIGLRNGDIIQSINGTPLDDPSSALGLMQNFRSAQQLNVTILRNKESLTLQYNIGG